MGAMTMFGDRLRQLRTERGYTLSRLAEIVHYNDYKAAGSLDAAYSAGKMSLEGKDYVIQDGDLIHIRNKS